MKKMREKVKEATASRTLLRKHLQELVKTLNPKIIGWRNYYATMDAGAANRFLAKVDWYLIKRDRWADILARA